MTTKKFGFLADFKKAGEKMDGVVTSAEEPRYWHSTGNHLLNAIMSGKYDGGLPQGRLTCWAGASGTGKSFLVGASIKEAQKDGAIILVIDSEGALDDGYMGRIGVQTGEENNYYYRGVRTIAQVVTVVSSFINGYRSEFGKDPDAPKVFIAIDSLDMLMSDLEAERYDKNTGGTLVVDHGLLSRQKKTMLRTFVQDIKDLNITMLVTHQVYKNQDLLNGEGVWVVNAGVKYSLSQIALLTSLKLREGSGANAEVTGIRLRVEGYKTRFTRPYQKIIIEVPYETGMDRFSGLLETGVAQGLIKQSAAWYTLVSTGDKFQRKGFDKYQEAVLAELIALNKPLVDAMPNDDEEEDFSSVTRKKKLEDLLDD